MYWTAARRARRQIACVAPDDRHAEMSYAREANKLTTPPLIILHVGFPLTYRPSTSANVFVMHSWPAGVQVCYHGSVITGYASRNESSSGCVFWRTIVCMAQHRRTCLTACGRHQRSSLVDVSALLTPRHYKCRRLVELPSATASFRWLQRVHGKVCHGIWHFSAGSSFQTRGATAVSCSHSIVTMALSCIE